MTSIKEQISQNTQESHGNLRQGILSKTTKDCHRVRFRRQLATLLDPRA